MNEYKNSGNSSYELRCNAILRIMRNSPSNTLTLLLDRAPYPSALTVAGTIEAKCIFRTRSGTKNR